MCKQCLVTGNRNNIEIFLYSWRAISCNSEAKHWIV